MTKEQKINQEEEVRAWLNKISQAEKVYEDYHALIRNIRKYYRNEIGKDKQNIFWSSVETLKPFLYFKQPKPYIERKEKAVNKVQNLACRMLEKALCWDLEQFDFDSVMKYARNDFLLSGAGLVIERYKPKFGTITDMTGKIFEIKTDEQVNTEYLDPVNFIADVDKVGTWEDCTWFAVCQYMTPQEAKETFGECFEAGWLEEQNRKSLKIYEVWDKVSERVLFLSHDVPAQFLKVIEGGLSLSNFYPLPKPLLATCTNDSLIPVPDYVQIKPLLDELDGVTARMEEKMKAIKISGCYDNAFPELASILNKEVTLVSISDFDRLKAAGGIKNIVDFMPIDQYITALQTLAQRRKELIEAIYEVTGVSDIMRGTSDSKDTATAIVKKTNFGTLRNQDRQNDMQKFMAEIFKIKAEIICEHFDTEKLLSFLPEEERRTPEALRAVQLLRTEKLRGIILGVESDVTFGEGDQAQKNIEAVKSLHSLIAGAFDIVSKQPALLGLYRQMIGSVVACLSNARQYEGVLENCFDKIAAEFAAPDEEETAQMPQQNLPLLSLQIQEQKNQNDYQIKKEQNDLKRAEIMLRAQELTAKQQ